jgi:hypothetical protein
MLTMGGSIDYRISSDETWHWEPKVISSPWGEEFDSLGKWTIIGTTSYTKSGYAMVPYKLD